MAQLIRLGSGNRGLAWWFHLEARQTAPGPPGWCIRQPVADRTVAVDRSICRTEGITMPRATRRPVDERARARLRDAQKAEADAVALVDAAVLNRERSRAKLDAVIATHRGAIDETDQAVNQALAHLVSVSGIDRASLLVDQPVPTLRGAVRSTTGKAGVGPA